MTAFAALTLADGQATPANHTFSPQSKDSDGTAWWVDRSGGIPVGYPRISLLVRPPVGPANGTSRAYRVKAKVSVPVLEVATSDGVGGYTAPPKLAYEDVGSVEFVLPERSSGQPRQDVLAYLQHLLAADPVVNAVKYLEGITS